MITQANEIIDSVAKLPPLLRQLFVGSKEGSIDHLPTIQLIDLGDSLVKFFALFYCSLSIADGKHHSQEKNLPGYLRDILSDDRGMSLGLSICILKEIYKIEGYQKAIVGKTADDSLYIRWAELRKRLQQIKSIKKLDFEYRAVIANLIKDFVINSEFLHKLHLSDNSYWTLDGISSQISLFPFFIIRACHQCGEQHLFAFDRYSKQSNDYTYICWGNDHCLEIGEGDVDLLEQLKKIKHDINNLEDIQANQSSYLPLFASSYPAMDKLVDLLYENTLDNQMELWVIKEQDKKEYLNWSDDIKNLRKKGDDIGVRHQIEAKERLIEQMIKNRILIDCIEKGPIMVMRNVAVVEGSKELPEYLEILLSKEFGGDQKQIDERKKNIKMDCENLIQERGLENSLVNMRPILDELYSVEVAKLLGFPIKDMKNFHNIEFYIDHVNREIAELTSSRDVGNYERTIDVHWFPKLEMLYREMIAFYSYVSHYETKKKIDKDQWSEELNKIMNLGLGSLNGMLRSLNESFDSRIAENIWGRHRIFDPQKYIRLVREGDKHGDLFGLRNALAHGSVNYYLPKPITNASRTQILSWIKGVMDFFADSTNRIFPYKISFTVLSQTHQGIRTCQYITALSDLGSTEVTKKQRGVQTKIYTDYEIDFTKYYYCIPHRRHSMDNIWVDPFLVPIDDIGFVETMK
jgi:hypothetical protein